MKVNILLKILRGTVMMLSSASLFDYFLTASDVPPVITTGDLYRFVAAYSIIFLITILDFLMCIKRKCRGGLFTLCFELPVLLIWIAAWNGQNFSIGNETVKHMEICILVGGMIASIVQVLAQFINLIVLHGSINNLGSKQEE